jgi:hypothetical protein
MILQDNLCILCKHKHVGSHPPTCGAFPKRIPTAIRIMEVDHREPFAGDNGITFQPKDDSEETLRRLAAVKVRSRQPVGTGTAIWDVLSDAQREAILEAERAAKTGQETP